MQEPKFKIGDEVETIASCCIDYRGIIIGIENENGQIYYEIRPIDSFFERECNIKHVNFN